MNHDPATLAEAFELFVSMRRRGESVDRAEFAARFPRFGQELGETLSAYERFTSALSEDDEGALPDRIGPYRVVREVGRGGMGIVLEAVEEPLGRRVALKVLPSDLLISPVARSRFRREARIAARLDHSGIATIFGASVEADPPWIAMRFVEGETLSRAISRAKESGASSLQPSHTGAHAADDARWIASLLARVARALQFAHDQGVLHRDVKPSNVIVTPDGTPVLVDFGLAVGDSAEGATLTRTGQVAGTPAYMAPELVGGEHARHDERCDIYALGVTLYECLALRRPFEGPTQVALYRAIVSGTATDVRTYNGKIPRDLSVIVATAMERDPARRYRSAAKLADDLEAFAGGRPIQARAVPVHERVLRWARREPRQAALSVLLATAVLATAVLTGTWWSSRETVLAAERAELGRRYESHLQDGFASLATRRPLDADAAFLRALEIEPTSREARIGRAMARFDGDRDAEAAEVLSDLPSSPAIDALRALLDGRVPPRDLGADWLRSASSIDLFTDGMRLAKQAQRGPRIEFAGLQKLAATRFGEAVNRAPTARAFYHMQRGFACRDVGDDAGARSAAAALTTLWPDSPRALFSAGNVLRQLEPDFARGLLERSVELDPTWGPPHQILANIHLDAGHFEGAIEESLAAIRFDPSDADAYNTLGLAYGDARCPGEARAAFLSAIALRPNRFESWANLSGIELFQGTEEAAEGYLWIAAATNPTDPYAHSQLARLLDNKKDRERAHAHVVAALAFDPEQAWTWYLLCAIEFNLKRFANAAWAGDQAVARDPNREPYRALRDLAHERATAERDAR